MRRPERHSFFSTNAGIAAILALVLGVVSVRAAVTQRDLAEAGLTPPPNAALPLNLQLAGEDGVTRPIKFWLGSQPSIWVLADYTCRTLCGPIISIVSNALSHSGLRPDTDFRLVVVGLDPKDTATDAASMKQAQIGLGDNFAASYFLRGDAGAIMELSDALGFRSVYDRDHDQFAHPAAAFVITPDGRLSQVLPGLAVDPTTIRLAIVTAGNGGVGTWADHIRLLCYGYDPASGTYTVAIGRILATAAVATITLLVLLIWLLLRHEYRARQSRTNARRFAAQSRTTTIE